MPLLLSSNRYDHDCIAHCERQYPPRRKRDKKIWFFIKKHWYNSSLVSNTNPLCNIYFRSDYVFREEKRRHYDSDNHWTVHPLSKINGWLQFYQIFHYMLAIWMKSFDLAFVRRSKMESGAYYWVPHVMNFCDFTSYLNLVLMFFVGFLIPDQKLVIIEKRGIFMYRIRSFCFWVDLISSTPKYMICFWNKRMTCGRYSWVVMNLIAVTKIILIYRLLQVLKNTFLYFSIDNKFVISFVQLFVIFFLTTHFMACLEFGIPRIRHVFLGRFDTHTWIINNGLIETPVITQYVFSIFKTSSQIFTIVIPEFQVILVEEVIFSLINYFVGKVIKILIWAALLNAIIARDIQDIKFQEIVSEVKDFIFHRQLPDNVKTRILDYYNYKYQGKFFNEGNITELLAESLKHKVNYHKSMIIKNSDLPIFRNLDEDTLKHVFEHFETEIYSANDVIITSGSPGTSLYVIASGSVAVFSHSGKEVCHLMDGSYFGELALVIKNQKCTATIVAIETCKVFRLDKKYFDKFLASNKVVYAELLKSAEKRLRTIATIEEDYKKTMFAESYKHI